MASGLIAPSIDSIENDKEWEAYLRHELEEAILCHDIHTLDVLVRSAQTQSITSFDLTDLKNAFAGLEAWSFESAASLSDANWKENIKASIEHQVNEAGIKTEDIKRIDMYLWRPTPANNQARSAIVSLGEYKSFSEWMETFCDDSQSSFVLVHDDGMTFRLAFTVGITHE